MTSEAVSVTVAEPFALMIKVGAETFAAVTVSASEVRRRIAPELMALPAADSVRLPPAVSVTSPVAEIVPATARSLPATAIRAPAVREPPDVIVCPDVSVMVPPATLMLAVVREPAALMVSS